LFSTSEYINRNISSGGAKRLNRFFGKRTSGAPGAPGGDKLAPAQNRGPSAATGPIQANTRTQLFPTEVFKGEVGTFLRSAGFAPDDPQNFAGQRGSTKFQLEEDYIQLQQIVASVNRTTATPVAPLHLLPPPLWETRYGPFLIEALDMSPYRPWNTIFFPVSRSGGMLKDLPLRDSMHETALSQELEATMGMVVDVYRGVDDGPANAFRHLFASIRQNHPDLFPPEQRDMTPRIVQARADLRTLAVFKGGADIATIRKCHAAFLGKPEVQLLA
jgi:hypothetical protein